MPPARFDVLSATWMHQAFAHEKEDELGIPSERRIPMSTLRSVLGLAASTISRITHRLEELELVRIVRETRDRRNVSVVLTETGVEALQLAVECITAERIGVREHIETYVRRRAFDGLSSEGRPVDVRQRVLVRLAAIIDRERAFARFLGSRAMPIYDTRVVPEIELPDVLDAVDH